MSSPNFSESKLNSKMLAGNYNGPVPTRNGRFWQPWVCEWKTTGKSNRR